MATTKLKSPTTKKAAPAKEQNPTTVLQIKFSPDQMPLYNFIVNEAKKMSMTCAAYMRYLAAKEKNK